ncbi:hypothetical protein VNO78_07886 [Psophocarpus tetragonolobus]|uniref:Uncharacterized protein n=1 Tax=Psophocarpus tetragonolobus TaxID=3891 RepID=A0AAN9T417_PSOTE
MGLDVRWLGHWVDRVGLSWTIMGSTLACLVSREVVEIRVKSKVESNSVALFDKAEFNVMLKKSPLRRQSTMGEEGCVGEGELATKGVVTGNDGVTGMIGNEGEKDKEDKVVKIPIILSRRG